MSMGCAALKKERLPPHKLNLFGMAYHNLYDPRSPTAELMIVWIPENHNPVVPRLINESIACAGVWVQDMDGVKRC